MAKTELLQSLQRVAADYRPPKLEDSLWLENPLARMLNFYSGGSMTDAMATQQAFVQRFKPGVLEDAERAWCR
jgi:hypothetical protein